MTPHTVIFAILLSSFGASAFAQASASSQSWEYRSYKKKSNGQWDKDGFDHRLTPVK